MAMFFAKFLQVALVCPLHKSPTQKQPEVQA